MKLTANSWETTQKELFGVREPCSRFLCAYWSATGKAARPKKKKPRPDSRGALFYSRESTTLVPPLSNKILINRKCFECIEITRNEEEGKTPCFETRRRLVAGKNLRTQELRCAPPLAATSITGLGKARMTRTKSSTMAPSNCAFAQRSSSARASFAWRAFL